MRLSSTDLRARCFSFSRAPSTDDLNPLLEPSPSTELLTRELVEAFSFPLRFRFSLDRGLRDEDAEAGSSVDMLTLPEI